MQVRALPPEPWRRLARVGGKGGSQLGGRRARTGTVNSRPLSAVVLAAGEGTRMRSSRTPSHCTCSPGDLHAPLRPRLAGRLLGRKGRRRGRPRCRTGDQEAAGRGARPGARLRRTARPAHGRRGCGRPHGSSGRCGRRRPARPTGATRRHPVAAFEHHRGSRGGPPRIGRSLHDPHRHRRRPDWLRADRATS